MVVLKRLLGGLFLVLILGACRASEEDLNKDATQVAKRIFNTQTAGAPTITPTETMTNTPTATPNFRATAREGIAETLTAIPTATATNTPTDTPTWTPSPTATDTDTPTATEDYPGTVVAQINETLTAIPTYTPSNTPTRTRTPSTTPNYEATLGVLIRMTLTALPSPTPSPNYTQTFQAAVDEAVEGTLVAGGNATPGGGSNPNPGSIDSSDVMVRAADLPRDLSEIPVQDIFEADWDELFIVNFSLDETGFYISDQVIDLVFVIVSDLDRSNEVSEFDRFINNDLFLYDTVLFAFFDLSGEGENDVRQTVRVGEEAVRYGFSWRNEGVTFEADAIAFRRGEIGVLLMRFNERGTDGVDILALAELMDDRAQGR